MTHRRAHEMAGISIQLDSDLRITENTFATVSRLFEIQAPGEGVLHFYHHFSLQT